MGSAGGASRRYRAVSGGYLYERYAKIGSAAAQFGWDPRTAAPWSSGVCVDFLVLRERNDA